MLQVALVASALLRARMTSCGTPVAARFHSDRPVMRSLNRKFFPLMTVSSLLCFIHVAEAATFVVPPDREMIHRSDAIVIATPTLSYSEVTRDGIETVTR